MSRFGDKYKAKEMFSEFRKSIDEIIQERLNSPFFGAFVVSWIIWNWQPIYLTIFVSEEQINNKLEFILSTHNSIWNLLWYPLLSTLFFILVAPFLTIGSYYIGLKFTSWRNKIRIQQEKNRLLTLEQSIKLREEINTQEERFDKLLGQKQQEIELLTKRLIQYSENIDKNIPNAVSDLEGYNHYDSELTRLQELMPNFNKKFTNLANRIIGGYTSLGTDDDDIRFFYTYDLIEKGRTNRYTLTVKGKNILRGISELTDNIKENQ